MSYVTIENPDSQLAQLVDQVTKGEEVIVVRDHAVVAKIVPALVTVSEPRKSGFGSAKDKLIYMADDFDAPLEDFKDYAATH